MCGIAGLLTQTARSDSAAQVAAMTRTLRHRGPDSEGTWVDLSAGIALGHCRLAVVDLSPAGHQPMVSASGRYVLVFNGEIYNFLDLRRELESACDGPALRFRGHSDTEAMLASFERWGVAESVTRFNGMFAFAVWDRQQRTLHLARDPMGEKPLYYGWTAGTFFFGSELKALRAHPAFPGVVDRDVLGLFLKHGYVPAPYSIYRNVFKLRPGTVLTMNPRSWRERTTTYWSFGELLDRAAADPFRESDAEAERQLESLLADAAGKRMIADVPLGAFLSGGIDSSLVVALMQSLSARPVKTFTIGFHESRYNEAVAAAAVAAHLRTDHTEWYVTPAEAQAVIPRLPDLYDEPFADSSQIPTFLVSALARKHVTVSLSGDGGDELFGGYERYSRISRQRRMLNAVPLPLRSLAAHALNAIAPGGAGHVMSAGLSRLPDRFSPRRLQRFAALAPLADPAVFYEAHQSHWRDPSEVVCGGGERPAPDDRPRCDNFVQHMMALDTVTYLPDDILVKVDRASMGVSLESRIPLLDPRIVEFAWRLPLNMKMRDGKTKWLLRRILYKFVPPALVERPKSGFGVPVAEWLRGPLRAWAEELLDCRRIGREGYFATEPIRRRWTEHLSARYDHSAALWSVLMFQAWLENSSRDVPGTPDDRLHPAASAREQCPMATK